MQKLSQFVLYIILINVKWSSTWSPLQLHARAHTHTHAHSWCKQYTDRGNLLTSGGGRAHTTSSTDYVLGIQGIYE